MKKVYVSRNYKHITSAGGKAKTDIEWIIRKIGYKNVALKQTQHSNKIIDFAWNFSGIVKSIFCIPRKGIVILQYPMKKYYSFMCWIANIKKAKIITIIHDLGAFRRKKLDVRQEIERLNGSDYIIATNKAMQNWLIANGCIKKIGSLNLWDYLSDNENTSYPHHVVTHSKYIVNYAGVLTRRKNSFLYQINPYINSFFFQLYGSGFSSDINNPNFTYKGFIHSDDFINNMNGDFGLVWDGNSLDICSGNFGIYLKYNTPHKISFYIRAHLPVIIWKDAAMAPFIEKENIGFTISSIKELDNILTNFPIERYNEMKKNTIALSNKLKEGYFITQATREAIRYLNDK